MPGQPFSAPRSHPANLTADRIARHRKAYAKKLIPAEDELLRDAIILLRELAYHR